MFPDQPRGRTIDWSVFVLVAPCSVGPGQVSAEDFRSVSASHGASPLQLSLVVRISHDAVTFACGRLAVDFVRKTVYLRQANLCTWLESHTVTANSLPYSTECTGNRRIYIYIRMRFASVANARGPIEPKLGQLP